MKRTISITLAIIFLIIKTSCDREKADLKSEGERLMEASREWSRSASSRDVEKILSYWSDDAILISAGEKELKGKEAIRNMIEHSMQNPNFQISWEPRTVEIAESGDMGYLLEDAKITIKDSTGNAVAQTFTSVTIWKKQHDGSWKNVVDVMSPKAED